MAHRELKVGSEAPDFTAKTQSGESWRLREALERGPMVVFFYPKDFTPICTAEVCEFNDELAQFAEIGAQVVGVSRDSVDSHAEFAARHGLGFTLLSDPDGKVRELFGIKKTLGLVDKRVTFIIDRQGVVAHVFASALNARAHVDEARRALARLNGG
jgi:peroxiredoxin Q/BCP